MLTFGGGLCSLSTSNFVFFYVLVRNNVAIKICQGEQMGACESTQLELGI